MNSPKHSNDIPYLPTAQSKALPAPEKAVVQAAATAMSVGGPTAIEAQEPSVDLLKEFSPRVKRYEVGFEDEMIGVYEGETPDEAIAACRADLYDNLSHAFKPETPARERLKGMIANEIVERSQATVNLDKLPFPEPFNAIGKKWINSAQNGGEYNGVDIAFSVWMAIKESVAASQSTIPEPAMGASVARQPSMDPAAAITHESIEAKYRGIQDRFQAEMRDLGRELVPGEDTAGRWLERANIARDRGLVDLIAPCSWQYERMTRFGKQSQ